MWHKTLVLCQPIETRHITLLYLSLKSLIKIEWIKKRKRKKVYAPQLLPPSSILCLPKPLPHHTPKHTATQVSRAMRGACKHTRAVVSYDPKVFFMICPFLNLDFKLLMGFSRFIGFFGASWIIYGINVISWLLISKDKAILARSKAIWRGYYIRIWCRTLFHIGFQSSLIAFCLSSSKSFILAFVEKVVVSINSAINNNGDAFLLKGVMLFVCKIIKYN